MAVNIRIMDEDFIIEFSEFKNKRGICQYVLKILLVSILLVRRVDAARSVYSPI